MYGALVIAYLFLGGTAAGGFFAMSAWSLALHRAPRTFRYRQAFASLQARVFTICLIMLMASIMFLLWDLEHPERVLLVLLRPHATVISFGAACLIVETLLGGILALHYLFHLPPLAGRVLTAMHVLCCAFSIATMTYTGVFLASNPAVPFWGTWSLVAVFACSSLSCGITLLLLVDYFIKDQTLLLRAARPLQVLHLACLAAEAASLAVFVATALNDPAAAHAIDMLRSPTIFPTVLIGIVGFGIAVPALLETYALTRTECRTIPVSDVLCLCGGLCLRYSVIVCGVH